MEGYSEEDEKKETTGMPRNFIPRWSGCDCNHTRSRASIGHFEPKQQFVVLKRGTDTTTKKEQLIRLIYIVELIYEGIL